MKPANLLIVLVLPVLTFAQRNQPNPQKEIGDELWRVRAQTLTEDALKDASNLNSLRRALVWGKLAELWWREDPRRGRTWLTSAVEVVEQVPNRESPQERQQRMGTAKFLLDPATRFDEKLSRRLIALVTDVDESTSASDRNGSANSLIHAAIRSDDPKRAAELGAEALRIGIPSDLADLLFALRGRDVKLADRLFLQALNVARKEEASALLAALTEAAFPKLQGVSDLVLEPPDDLKTELLKVQAAFLSAHANELQGSLSICWAVSGFVVPVLSEFDRLLPQQAMLVRQTIQKCRSVIPNAREELEAPGSSQSLNTVDGLLKASAESEISSMRTLYQLRAAMLAKDHGDFERGIKILDNMSDESREVMQGSWAAYRWDWSASAALDHFQNGRLGEMNLVLDAVPPKLQPFAKMAFLDRLPVKKLPEGTPVIQFLNEAGVGLRKSSISESEKFVWYFGLLKLTMRYQRSDAIAVFKEAIASLNRAVTEDSKFLDTNEFANFLPASLLEIDEFSVKETLASVTNVEARIQLRLQLVKEIQSRAR